MGQGFKNIGYVSVLNNKTVSDILEIYENDYSDSKLVNYDVSTTVFNGQKLFIIEKTFNDTKKLESNAKPLLSCTIEDFKQAKGVGDKTALLIQNYIKVHPNIKSTSELIAITGVGEKTVNEIKKYCY